MLNDVTNNSSTLVWIDDGILFADYRDTMTTADVLRREEIAIQLLNAGAIKLIPFVLVLTNVSKATFSLKLSDYGKIITSTDFMKRITGIWAVGVPEDLENYAIPIISSFFGKKFYFMDSLEQAKKAAKESLTAPTPLLE